MENTDLGHLCYIRSFGAFLYLRPFQGATEVHNLTMAVGLRPLESAIQAFHVFVHFFGSLERVHLAYEEVENNNSGLFCQLILISSAIIHQNAKIGGQRKGRKVKEV